MDPEDLEPRKHTPEKKNLEIMSVEELQWYIGHLEGEIVRARDTIQQKQKARAGAESFFRR